MKPDWKKWPPKPKVHDVSDSSDGSFYKHRDTGRGTEWINTIDSPWVRTSIYEVRDLVPLGDKVHRER